MIEPNDDSARTVLVTGAAGFIGSALCAQLCSCCHRVIAYDNFSRGRRDLLPSGADVVEGDIRDANRLHEAVARWKPEWLIHLAAMHFIPECVAHPERTLEVNVEGTRRVFENCRNSSIRHVIFASSGAVYAPSDLPCGEDTTPLGPLEVYGESKAAGESLARNFHEQTGIATTILRLFNAIGPNETNAHVVPHILASLQTSDTLPLGNTLPRRDYVDTRDIAAAILAVATRLDGFRVFNVGTGVGRSVNELVTSLAGILGRPVTILQDPGRMRAVERMVLVADIERICRETGWRPRIAFDDTLRAHMAEYRLDART
jgi:UDP-glucose 4-epimerase